MFKTSMMIIVFIMFVATTMVFIDNAVKTSNENSCVCILDDFGNCKVDITNEFYNANVDSGRECDQSDRYYETTRFICVKSISNTDNPYHINRGCDSILTTYFTEVDRNHYIFDSKEVVGIEPNKLYYIHYLIQAGYCRGAGKILSYELISDSCDHCSESPGGIPMGFCPQNGE